jgi:hypothetical protein
MRLQNERQLQATREKLQMLEEQYEATRQRPGDNERLRELTLSTLGRLIKQLKEEIMWYESHARAREPSSPAVTSLPNTGETSSPCTN